MDSWLHLLWKLLPVFTTMWCTYITAYNLEIFSVSIMAVYPFFWCKNIMNYIHLTILIKRFELSPIKMEVMAQILLCHIWNFVFKYTLLINTRLSSSKEVTSQMIFGKHLPCQLPIIQWVLFDIIKLAQSWFWQNHDIIFFSVLVTYQLVNHMSHLSLTY